MNIMDSDVFKDYFRLYKLSKNTQLKKILIQNNLGILDLNLNYDYSNETISKRAIKGFITSLENYELDKSCGFVKFAITYINMYKQINDDDFNQEINYWYQVCIRKEKDNSYYNKHLT